MTESLRQKIVQTEKPSPILFGFVNPTVPIIRPGIFKEAYWGDVAKPDSKLTIRGARQQIEVFGFQALRGGAGVAEIAKHPELDMTELTFMVTGNADLTIDLQNEHPVVSQMRGPIPEGVDLRQTVFSLESDGVLWVVADGINTPIYPTVTPKGASHSTQPLSKECIYLAVKVRE